MYWLSVGSLNLKSEDQVRGANDYHGSGGELHRESLQVASAAT